METLQGLLKTEIVTEFLVDGFYVADLYVPDKNLVVEVQGPIHVNGLN